MTPLENLIKESEGLPLVPLDSITAYQSRLDSLIDRVNKELEMRADIDVLIGRNPMQIMRDNHRNHAAFMATVFGIGRYTLLTRTIVWVYRAYRAHGFSYEYFPVAFDAWMSSVSKELDSPLAAPILAVYAWLKSSHEKVISIAESETELPAPIHPEWFAHKDRFLRYLLDADSDSCVKMADEVVSGQSDVEMFYLYVVQPALYEVGMLWERAEISVAEEHLASAIVARVLAGVAHKSRRLGHANGRAIVSASANEFHEIGAWMISDVLEQDGWDVRYLGANTPVDALLSLGRDFRPDLLAISVTLLFNLSFVRKAIAEFKADPLLADTKIMVGGRIFNEGDSLWKDIGADAFASNVVDARDMARQWQPKPA